MKSDYMLNVFRDSTEDSIKRVLDFQPKHIEKIVDLLRSGPILAGTDKGEVFESLLKDVNLDSKHAMAAVGFLLHLKGYVKSSSDSIEDILSDFEQKGIIESVKQFSDYYNLLSDETHEDIMEWQRIRFIASDIYPTIRSTETFTTFIADPKTAFDVNVDSVEKFSPEIRQLIPVCIMNISVGGRHDKDTHNYALSEIDLERHIKKLRFALKELQDFNSKITTSKEG